MGRFGRVQIATGEAPTDGWAVPGLSGGSVPIRVEPALRYAGEQWLAVQEQRRRIDRAFRRWIAPGVPTVVWVHNPGLARNVALLDVLRDWAGRPGVRMVFHHHDFWLDNRWERWPELRRQGVRSVGEMAEKIFAADRPVVHCVINGRDFSALRGLGAVRQVPNPFVFPKPARLPRAWRRAVLGGDGPYWVCPTRILRRKNLAEAILLARWFAPESTLVVAGEASAGPDADYAARLRSATSGPGWRVRWGVLAGPSAPPVSALVRSAQLVLQTSVLEGFGLTAVEAAAAGRPALVRRIGSLENDLRSAGLRGAVWYDDVFIAPGLWSGAAERRRQEVRWKAWRRALPAALRARCTPPLLLALPPDAPVPFSRLTLDAQIEVLGADPVQSRAACAGFNQRLFAWARKLESGTLPEARLVAGRSFLPAVTAAFTAAPRATPAAQCRAVQARFLENLLGDDAGFPVLWAP
jgi:glycosyltransferase involved in cell wall biosynthesis